MGPAMEQIDINQLVAIFVALIAAWNSWRSKVESQQINKAVNQRPKGEPTIYEQCASNTRQLSMLHELLQETKESVNNTYERISKFEKRLYNVEHQDDHEE